jgi:hypothetical protein
MVYPTIGLPDRSSRASEDPLLRELEAVVIR